MLCTPIEMQRILSKMNRVFYVCLTILLWVLNVPVLHADQVHQADVVIIGGTPGGIASAVAAGRAGCNVTLVEYHERIGGMMASGLGKSDIENRAMIGGLFREFVDRVHAHYVKRYG
jgi:NADPH-dependent 2,4-dienoyl-CoA reductase/sulfur reductase-like enzyme